MQTFQWKTSKDTGVQKQNKRIVQELITNWNGPQTQYIADILHKRKAGSPGKWRRLYSSEQHKSSVNGELQRELSVVWNDRMQIQHNQQHYSHVPKCSSDVRANLTRKTPGPNQTIATTNTNYKKSVNCTERPRVYTCERKLSNQNVMILSEAITILYMCNLVLYINKVCYKSCGYSWQADAKTPSRSILLSPTVRWSLEVLKTHNILQVQGTTGHALRESRNRSISARFTRFTDRLYTANRKFEVKDLI